MSPSRSVLLSGCAVLVAWTFLFSPLFGAPEDHLKKYSTPKVRLYTDIGREAAEKILEDISFFENHIDGFFAAYGISQKKENPIRCRLYNDARDFTETRRKANVQAYAGAYFSESNNSIIAPYNQGSEAAISALRHECAHQIVRRYFSQVPRWFDEGFACFFEGVTFDAYQNLVSCCGSKARLERMRYLVQTKKLEDWEAFFGHDNELVWRTRVDRAEQNIDNFYAQAWGVVFFYLSCGDEKATELFTRFLRGMNTGRERSDMLLEDLSARAVEMERFFDRDHRRVLKLFLNAQDLERNGYYAKALQSLQQILEEEPEHRASIRLAAETTWEGGDYIASLDYWKTLYEMDDKESLFQWRLCCCMVERGLRSNDPAMLEEAVRLGKAAVKLTQCKDPDCFAALARAHHATGRIRDALSAIRNANRFRSENSEEYHRLEAVYSEELKNR